MKPTIEYENNTDEQGNPAGGHVKGEGLSINWQKGPLRGLAGEQLPRNGAFVEDVLHAAQVRLQHFQKSRFRCNENDDALMYIQRALDCLDARTADRTARGVEGTHQK